MLPSQRLEKLNTIENLWIYILIILNSRNKKYPIYAWEIPNLIEKFFGFKTGKITPYRVLYRLESQYLVKSEYHERKRFYQITEAGKKELEAAKSFYKKIILSFDKQIGND